MPSRQALTAPLRVAFEVGAILVELVRIPLRAWLRVAEVAGAVVLAAWKALWPLAHAASRRLRRVTAVAARVVTPRRTLVVVSLLAAAALIASQFVDYRAVQIGAPAYRSVTGVAPPPQVSAATPQTPHGLWLIAIGGVAAAIVVLSAATGRWRAARLLIPLGAAAAVIAIAVDAPEGLRTGQAGIAYQGARATLLSGFGAEVAAAGVLAACGVLFALYGPAAARRRSRRRLRVRRRSRSERSRRRERAPASRTAPRKASG